MKKCCRCNIEEFVEEFYKCKKAKDGLQSSCKDCKRQFNSTRNNPVTVEYKNCSKCKVSKHRSNFRRNKSSSDGLRHECKKCKYLMDKKYRDENFEKVSIVKRKYERENRDKLNQKRRELYHSDIDKYRARSNFYTTRRKNSTPDWCNDYKDEWERIYNNRLQIEKDTGIKHHIDHIIPVINDKVCGLSVPWNYQIITEEENIRKSNKFDGTYDNESWR